MQMLADISLECKERGTLLYKFFKIYFTEQEKKWTLIINKMQEKITYYKDLCKTVIQQKNKHLDKLERINDVLFTQKLTKDNLDEHKKLIKDLLAVINEKQEEIYLLKSNNESLENELKLWVYDFDKLKLNNNVREEYKNFNVEKLAENVNNEMKHKK